MSVVFVKHLFDLFVLDCNYTNANCQLREAFNTNYRSSPLHTSICAPFGVRIHRHAAISGGGQRGWQCRKSSSDSRSEAGGGASTS